jgi:hypothetical protein
MRQTEHVQLMVGTDDGLYELTDAAPRRLRDGKVTHLAAGSTGAWMIANDRIEPLTEPSPEDLALPDGLKPRCLLATPEALFIGTSEAHLYRSESGEVSLVEGFDRAEGRERWHTPWGGPPDTRSMARDAGGSMYANVHVGGVLRSADGQDWQPTMDIEADVHEVGAHPTVAGCVLVASARGLGLSFDGAATWEFTRDGLHSSYARAVAVDDEMLFISASAGPRGGRAALYRRPLRGDGPLERCRSGLPEWFEGNIDSGCLVASGGEVAFGTQGGQVYASQDDGSTWSQASRDLPPVRALLAMPAGTPTAAPRASPT